MVTVVGGSDSYSAVLSSTYSGYSSSYHFRLRNHLKTSFKQGPLDPKTETGGIKRDQASRLFLQNLVDN